MSEFADDLGGQLVETSAKPVEFASAFSTTDASTIAVMLKALEQFFADDDADALVDALRPIGTLTESLGVTNPLAALVLYGLDKVGLSGRDQDLRVQPLYEMLAPHLQHRQGFIRLKISDEEYTVRIGLTTHSVFFPSKATEPVIEFVRSRVVP